MPKHWMSVPGISMFSLVLKFGKCGAVEFSIGPLLALMGAVGIGIRPTGLNMLLAGIAEATVEDCEAPEVGAMPAEQRDARAETIRRGASMIEMVK